MGLEPLVARSKAFVEYVEGWVAGLASTSMEEVAAEAGGGERVAVACVDVINGFCKEGPLASERIQGIVLPIRRLFERVYGAGVRRFALLRDAHTAEAVEFGAWAPHCRAGTDESEIVDELKELPFAGEYDVIEKNAISAWHGGEAFPGWVKARHAEGVRTFITVGDCTDLCLYQLAMAIRLWANEKDLPVRVIVPESCVQTYDLSVEAARELGVFPHDGDLLHAVFLYHLALNGVDVVKEIA